MLEVHCIRACHMGGGVKAEATIFIGKEVNSPNNIRVEYRALFPWSHKGSWHLFTYGKKKLKTQRKEPEKI